jgi:hypothetical protein
MMADANPQQGFLTMPYYGQLLFALQSFDNDALYHRNGKASPQFLVRPFALALVELRASMSIQILKLKNLNRAAEIAMDIYKVEQRMEADALDTSGLLNGSHH